MAEVDFLSDLFWAIDPGESKCGVAIFQGGVCRTALKSTPDECLDRLWGHLEAGHGNLLRPAAVVVERFALRADLAPQQKGSEMGTSQMIGVVRWMCRHFDVPLDMQTPWQAHSIGRAAPFTDWPLRKFLSYGQGTDAKMAELHGLFRISTSINLAARREWHQRLLEY